VDIELLGALSETQYSLYCIVTQLWRALILKISFPAVHAQDSTRTISFQKACSLHGYIFLLSFHFSKRDSHFLNEASPFIDFIYPEKKGDPIPSVLDGLEFSSLCIVSFTCILIAGERRASGADIGQFASVSRRKSGQFVLHVSGFAKCWTSAPLCQRAGVGILTRK
jgi:hypothetical protein